MAEQGVSGMHTKNESSVSHQMSDPETWVDQYGDYLYRHALARTQDPGIAEDMVQETFLGALHARDTFKGHSTEKTWLVGILKHKILDYIRKKSREQPVGNIEAIAESADEFFDEKGHWRVGPAKWAVNPRKLLERKEFWEIFSNCLSGLSDRLAQAFMLRELDGLSGEEIRKILNVTATNTYAILSRARMRMRNCLEVKWLGQKATKGQ